MLKKIRLSVMALFISGMAFAQSTGSIIFTVVDADTKEAIPFASILVTKGGAQVGTATTDMSGLAEVKPLDPGEYDVKIPYTGYNDFIMTKIEVKPNEPTHVTVKMVSVSKTLGPVTIVYQKPAIDVTGHVGGGMDAGEIKSNPEKGSIDDMVGTLPGFSQVDLGQPLHAVGTRTEENQYIIDGVKITADQANGGLPQSMIGEINTYVSGVPAKYGDATGGIIEINTINPSPKFFGTVEGITSELLDPFGYNDFNFVIGGPIWSKRDSTGKKSPNAFPSVNFILGGEFASNLDASPSFVGGYYVNSNTLSQLQNNPLVVNPLGGFNRSAEYITDADIYHSDARQNDASQSYSGNGKIDIRLNPLATITVGGSYQYTTRHDYESVYELFNSIEDPLDNQTSYRAFVRYRQRFNTAPPSKDGKPALIQNAYYSLQAEYGNTYDVIENTNFKNNLFDYGYVGQFNQLLTPTYAFKTSGYHGPGYYQTGFADSLLTYSRGSENPYMANYTSDVYNTIGAKNITNSNIVEENLGLMNGDAVSNVYSLWYNTGRSYPSYEQQNSNHFSFDANFSATIKNNDIQIGFTYEQNILSFYSINAPALWSLMRQNTDLQISQMDTNGKDAFLTASGMYNTWGQPRAYDASLQSQFDKSLREKLGLPVNSTVWLDPDNYAPSMYSLSMFSASDLLNNGSSIVSYYGYNYQGQLSNSNPTIDDFFNQRDANGNLTYPVAPYHPIYMAGYIQDHFDFKSLRFDVGLRVDRFDANQPVLKDPYLLQPAKTVAEVKQLPLGETIPGNVSNNDIVYVNNSQTPTAIVGYRNGSTWYNASGDIITDPTVLASATSSGNIQPYLENPNPAQITGSNAFTTYTPQISVMPRIAFSFPISDMAGFFAHYDVLTSRPPGVGYNLFLPTQYLYINSNVGGLLQNPDLKPVETIDYELGFTQALNEKKTTALTLSAFYRAPRSEIEAYRFLDAYPVGYIAYNNIDFGTIKGLTLAYSLSRVGDFKLRASYTLQFATGTGSGPSSGYNLANSGNPNLQIPIPLDFDVRHNIQVSMDYHFQSGDGGGYDGPVIKTHSGKSVEILANAGINLTLIAQSGTPYTVQGNATEGDPNSENVGIGIAQHYSLVGSVNGSNLPWQYRIDLRADKDFPLTIKGKDKDKEGHKCDIMVYLSITNLLNTENIINVYHYTGSPTDDGFLASTQGQLAIAGSTSPQAFIDQYKIKEQDPTYLAMPRTIHLGVNFNF